MPKQIKTKQQAYDVIKSTVEEIAGVVGSTLGPRGSFVSLTKENQLCTTTNDGATIAKNISFADGYKNAVAQILNSGCEASNKVGDGTTSTLVMAKSMVINGLKYKAASASAISMTRGIDKAVAKVVEKIDSMSTPVKSEEAIRKVATISANNDEAIGDLIASAYKELGLSSVLTIEESKTGADSFVASLGLEIRNSVMSPYFMVRAKDGEKLDLKDPFILLYDKSISQMKPLVPILEKVMQTGKPLLILCESMDGEALSTLIMNILQNPGFNVFPVKSAYYGDKRKAFLEDIAALTGGKLISEDAGMSLEKVSLDDLGTCEKVAINRESTTIIGGKGSEEAKKARIEKIKRDLDFVESDFDKDSLKERLAKIESGVGILKIGSQTQGALEMRRLLAEDAMMSSRAAIESGVITGGGISLLRAMDAVDDADYKNEDEKLGGKLVKMACRSILETIAENAGENGAFVVESVLKNGDGDYGYNAATGEYEDLAKAGVIEPAKVVTSALKSAASISNLLLLTDSIVSELPKDEDGFVLANKPTLLI